MKLFSITALLVFFASAVVAQNPVQTVYDTGNAGLIYYSDDPFSGKVIGDKLQNFTSTIGKRGCEVWVGTYGGGIAVFDGLDWIQIEQNDVNIDTVNVLSNFVSAVCGASNGDIWVGNTGLEGVIRFKADGVTVNYQSLNTGGQYPANALDVTKIVEGKNGDIWVATKTHGIVKYNGTSWTKYNNANSGLLNDNVKTMAYNPVKDRIWIGCTSGAAYFDGVNWTTVTTKNTWGLGVDDSGDVWIGGGVAVGYGVVVHNETTFIDTPITSGWAVNAIDFDSKGNAWIGTALNGMRKWTKATKAISLIPTPGGSTARIYDVYVDENDNVHISSQNFFEIYNDSGIVYCIEFDNDHLCFGETSGSSTAVPKFGTSPYTYNWSNSATTAAITGISGGTYSVTVTDDSGYVAYGTTQIVQADSALSVDTILTQPSWGGFDGAITLVVTGSIPPYSYFWNNGKKTATINNLFTGTYTVTVTDSIGCKDTVVIALISGVDNLSLGREVVIFPNPASSQFDLLLRTASAGKISAGIYDLAGRLLRRIIPGTVLPAGEHRFTCDTNEFSPGTYQLVLHDGTRAVSGKLLIIK